MPPCMTARLNMTSSMSGCSGMPLLKPCISKVGEPAVEKLMRERAA